MSSGYISCRNQQLFLFNTVFVVDSFGTDVKVSCHKNAVFVMVFSKFMPPTVHRLRQ